MVKQLKLPFELQDLIFNLSKQERKYLISELKVKLMEANHENSQWGENPKFFRVWQYLKNNPFTAKQWIKEILNEKENFENRKKIG